MDAKPLSI